MGLPLRDRESPKALAEARQSFDFEVTLQDFSRLREIVAADLGKLDEADRPEGWHFRPVRGRLSFGFADLGETLPVVSGRVGTTLDVVCQRCLQPFELPLSVTLDYALVAASADANDANATEVDGYEVWELVEDRLQLADLVEEALVMALPMSAAHATPAECGPLAKHVIDESSPEKRTTRPFAGLKAELAKKN